MAEQAISMRSLTQVLRRRRWLLLIVAVLGFDAGVALVIARPPAYQSTSLVLLAPAVSGGGQPVDRDMDTEVQIASSAAVLAPVERTYEPHLSRRTLDDHLDVSSPTSDVIAVQATGTSRANAERLARAVADAVVDHQTEATSSLSTAQRDALQDRRLTLQESLDTIEAEIGRAKDRLAGLDPESVQGKADATVLGQLTAQQAELVLQLNALEQRATSTSVGAGATILEGASPAQRPHLAAWIVLVGLAGALLSVALASVVILLLSRQDPRLLSRDEIADALGRPVLASLRAHAGRDPAGWRNLLVGYVPEVEADLALRQALLAVGIHPGRAPASERASSKATAARLTVVSLSDDPAGLAMGPQLAAHAASLGVPTRLVVLPGHPSVATLAAVCSGDDPTEPLRPGLWVDTRLRKTSAVVLTVIQVVLDRQDPDSQSVRLGPRAMIAVSAGSATSQELARAAVWTYQSGGRLLGALVADPDALDNTSGRLLQPDRAQQAPLPTRLTGLTTSRPRPVERNEGSA